MNDSSEETPSPQDRYVGYAEAGRMIGKDRETIRYHASQGTIEAISVMEGRRNVYKVRVSDLRAFAKERGLPFREDPVLPETPPQAPPDTQDAPEFSGNSPSENFGLALRQELSPMLQRALRDQGAAYVELAHELGDARQKLGEESAKREAAEKEAERLRQELEESSRNRRGFWARLFGID